MFVAKQFKELSCKLVEEIGWLILQYRHSVTVFNKLS